MRLHIPYGDTELPFDLPDGSSVHVVWTTSSDPSASVSPAVTARPT